MTWNLCTIDWIAIGSVATGAMAIATFRTLRNNKKQFRELQKQNIAIQKQSFENTLFQLLHEVKRLLGEVTAGNSERSGVRVLEKVYTAHLCYNMAHSVNERKPGFYEEPKNITPTEEIAEAEYIKIFDEIVFNLGAYFRSLYRVIKYIDESDLTAEEKYQYTSFVRAQLTDIELLWLFYNCTVGYGKEKFKPLIEKYTLLKNMPIGRLVSSAHKDWINSSALERRNK